MNVKVPSVFRRILVSALLGLLPAVAFAAEDDGDGAAEPGEAAGEVELRRRGADVEDDRVEDEAPLREAEVPVQGGEGEDADILNR